MERRDREDSKIKDNLEVAMLLSIFMISVIAIQDEETSRTRLMEKTGISRG